jgi:hypothetical protein
LEGETGADASAILEPDPDVEERFAAFAKTAHGATTARSGSAQRFGEDH